MVSRRRGRRLQHHAAGAAAGLRTSSSSWSFRSCSGAGCSAPQYEGRTLRENLGLPRPANRFRRSRRSSRLRHEARCSLTRSRAEAQSTSSGRERSRSTCALHLDDEVVLLDRHREGLGDVGTLHQLLARLDRDLELPRPRRFRIAPGLAGADVELPAVPRAAQELALRAPAGTRRARRTAPAPTMLAVAERRRPRAGSGWRARRYSPPTLKTPISRPVDGDDLAACRARPRPSRATT